MLHILSIQAATDFCWGFGKKMHSASHENLNHCDRERSRQFLYVVYVHRTFLLLYNMNPFSFEIHIIQLFKKGVEWETRSSMFSPLPFPGQAELHCSTTTRLLSVTSGMDLVLHFFSRRLTRLHCKVLVQNTWFGHSPYK